MANMQLSVDRFQLRKQESLHNCNWPMGLTGLNSKPVTDSAMAPIRLAYQMAGFNGPFCLHVHSVRHYAPGWLNTCPVEIQYCQTTFMF